MLRISCVRRLVRAITFTHVNIHPSGRLFFGLGCFISALLAHDMTVVIPGIILCVILLRIINKSWMPVFRAIRLLLWLILPIFFLHLFSTPGALIWPGGILPFTWEGVYRATWLSTRLLFLFFSAMLLSRSLSLEEWEAQLCHIPVMGRRLYPYLQLFHPMREQTSRLVRKHWREGRSRGIVWMPEMMVCLLEDILRSSHDQAKVVWKDWTGELPSYDLSLDGRTLVLMLISICLPFTAWVA